MMSGRPLVSDPLARGNGVARIRNAAPAPTGRVYLVGAGPGDPDLLTLKADRLLRQADVIVYDRLAGPEILSVARPEAERIFVGKLRGLHALPQNRINALLIDLASAGRCVVRLKGGDPFVFGRGGEEAEALADAGIPYEIVPGVTAALGCAASALIPLTHRDHAQTLSLVTGTCRDGAAALDWSRLAGPGRTLALYMAAGAAEALVQRAVVAGLPPSTPAAVIVDGTTPREAVHVGTLLDLPVLCRRIPEHRPVLIVIGQVVELRARLAVSASAATRRLSLRGAG